MEVCEYGHVWWHQVDTRGAAPNCRNSCFTLTCPWCCEQMIFMLPCECSGLQLSYWNYKKFLVKHCMSTLCLHDITAHGHTSLLTLHRFGGESQSKVFVVKSSNLGNTVPTCRRVLSGILGVAIKRVHLPRIMLPKWQPTDCVGKVELHRRKEW